jgi:hypothetical protein
MCGDQTGADKGIHLTFASEDVAGAGIDLFAQHLLNRRLTTSRGLAASKAG